MMIIFVVRKFSKMSSPNLLLSGQQSKTFSPINDRSCPLTHRCRGCLVPEASAERPRTPGNGRVLEQKNGGGSAGVPWLKTEKYLCRLRGVLAVRRSRRR